MQRENNEEVFIVMEGTLTFHLAGEENEVAAGSFLRIPSGVSHGFRNPAKRRAAVLNFFIPGGFEHQMPAIVGWDEAEGAGRGAHSDASPADLTRMDPGQEEVVDGTE